jgi:ABC-type multidrug transport system, ATPase and permease components
VPQKNLLFTGTILDNLRWGNESASFEEIVNCAKIAMADDFIKTFKVWL